MLRIDFRVVGKELKAHYCVDEKRNFVEEIHACHIFEGNS